MLSCISPFMPVKRHDANRKLLPWYGSQRKAAVLCKTVQSRATHFNPRPALFHKSAYALLQLQVRNTCFSMQKEAIQDTMTCDTSHEQNDKKPYET